MRKFFKFDCENNQKEITISGEDARHISRSLRMKGGDKVCVCNGTGYDIHCTIALIDRENVYLTVEGVEKGESEPKYGAVLFQALAKSDKMDTIVQKAVECGVTEIIPFESKYCIAKIGDGIKNKLNRWRKISLEAAKQCGRCIVPKISEPVSYAQAVLECSKGECSFICYEEERGLKLGSVAKPMKNEYRFMIGPEGGFSEEEIKFANENGVVSVGLGKRILRCETASSFVLACLCMENELRDY
ncbi:MAG: RsmE family RNA methyltransferase [Clostridia bacterium]|nr:RsmE family RNA methyltransferase [Clostridia bacterium]